MDIVSIMVSTQQTITTNLAKLSNEGEFIRIKFINSEDPFDLEEAHRQYEAARKLSNNQNYKVLIDVRDVIVSPDKDAQEYLVEVQEKVAEAILVNNFAVRLLSRFYVRKSKNNPVRIFSKERKAIQWLMTH